MCANTNNEMNNENKTIHDFDFNLICEFFSSMERQGPGSTDATLTALRFIDNLTEKSLIADIGCGTGGQTMTLAKHIEGKISALDLFPDFINILNRNAKQLGMEDRVKGIVGSMDNLPFQNEELDLIWSEGAIYNIGFERGLKEWSKYLKKGGYVAVTDATWFTNNRPFEIEDFWVSEYPGITTMSDNIAIMQKSGYTPVAAFRLHENCWIENYYSPQIQVQEKFLQKHEGNKLVEEFISCERHEAKMYNKYKDYYGYVFYIGKKID